MSALTIGVAVYLVVLAVALVFAAALCRASARAFSDEDERSFEPEPLWAPGWEADWPQM